MYNTTEELLFSQVPLLDDEFDSLDELGEEPGINYTQDDTF